MLRRRLTADHCYILDCWYAQFQLFDEIHAIISDALVQTTPCLRRGGRHGGGAGPSSDGLLRIATNLLDVPAELIADIYRHRWTIELFFRFLKHVLGCRHLLSQDPVGIEIQTYCAIIVFLLISLTTGCKPTLRTYEMVCLYLQGWADEEELIAHLQKLKRQAV